jgi:hypothetical protein
MKKVIDVRDMHTAIHSLYIVNKKPKTTLKMFKELVSRDFNGEIDGIFSDLWDGINENTEYFGEINFRKITGDKFWRNGDLLSDNEYHCGDNHFKLIGSFDIF